MDEEKFKNGDKVRITASGEKGRIVGTGTYIEERGPTRFWVEFVASDGRFTDGWFYADQLEADAS